ncbi:MAG: hypothetical protein WDZ90_01485 [Candidatus Paceibacterota bacterium]
MLEPWLNFVVVIFIQLLLLIVYACYKKKLSDVPRILGLGIVIGMGVGLLSDLVLGKFFGLWSYALGFSSLPLMLTAVFVYGLFSASILLMQHARLLHFFVLTMIMMVVYETTNYFFRVWSYELTLPFLGLLAFLIVGYFTTAVFVAVTGHVFFKHRFFYIDTLLKSRI